MNKLGNEYKMKYVTKVSFRNIPRAELKRGKSLPSWPKDMGHRNPCQNVSNSY